MKKGESKKGRVKERRNEKIKKGGLVFDQEKSSRPLFLMPVSLTPISSHDLVFCL